MPAMKVGKPLTLMPRLAQLGEHGNDHQLAAELGGALGAKRLEVVRPTNVFEDLILTIRASILANA